MLSTSERDTLVRLARAALEARVRGVSPPPVGRGGALDARCGAFVTIRHARELRGCLGRIETDMCLSEVVAHLAAVVSDSDPRFPPVTEGELAHLSIEISVLTPECEVTDIEHIEIGRHGLIIEQGFRRGLLLPQVATEHGWDRVTFLEHTCVKAGLARDAWQRGARVLCFEAFVFEEDSSTSL